MLSENKNTIARIVLSIIIFGLINIVPIPTNIYLCMVLVAYLIAGVGVIKKSFKDVTKGDFFDENFLMLIATVGALLTEQYIEAISVMIIYEIGEMLQDKAVDDSKQAITELMDVRPKYANLQCDGVTKKVLPKDVNVDDIILVGAGESIPLDGVIVKGESNIDLSSLTGESLPQYVKTGDTVYSGGVNIDGTIYIKVTKIYKESTISKILDFIEKAKEQKSSAEGFMTRFSKKYTPAVILIAVLFVIFSRNIPLIERIRRACMFLVISCPCALVLSIPLCFFYGIGVCSKNGILIKGGVYLEMLSNIKNIIFDKTGTLTKGKFKVVKVYDKYNKDILKIAAYCEANSTHPIARAIRNEYGKDIDHNNLHNIKEQAGLGTSCTLDGKDVLVGNKRLMEKNSISIDEDIEDRGIVYVAYDNEYIGYILVADEIKNTTYDLVPKLRKKGLNVAMITGDSKEIALDVANKLDIKDVFYEIFPDEKASIVSGYMKEKNSKVAFVGDGINDVPSILTADVGIAMGGIGSDATIEASNIVIMDDDLSKIDKAIQISKKTLTTVKQNIVFILAVKVLVLVLCGMGHAKMWAAIVADVGVSMIAILHSTHGLKSLKK